jgi:putative transposase
MKRSVTLGFKYRMYPSKTQKELLDHQMFISNQAYNICLNLKQKEWERNKDLEKKDRVYLKPAQIDSIVKHQLSERNLPFKTVTTQQARKNSEKAYKNMFDSGFGSPKFKNSSLEKQSFTWNNQGCQIIDKNHKFKYLRLWRENILVRVHRDLPENYKLNSIHISRDGEKYFVSFSVTFDVSIDENIDISKAIGIDLNIHEIALSDGNLIKTNSKEIGKLKYEQRMLRLQRKQSRRVLKAKKYKQKLGSNFRKTQKRLNSTFIKVKNQKSNHYHKITSELSKKFDLIVVEDLKNKNMTAKGGSRKKGLNRSILNTSFYQFVQYLDYKTAMLNGKHFLKVPPHYTSKTCFKCGHINRDLKLSDRVFKCPECGYIEHRDINASKNILKKGLKSLGSGIDLQTIIESLADSVSNSDKVS